MASSWVYLTLGVIVALIALGAVAINTALEQVSNHKSAKLMIADDELERIHTFCPNPEIIDKDNDVLVICLGPNGSRELGIFKLPPPVYKRVLCTSTYGCSGTYNYIEQIPPDLLTPEQKQMVIDKVMSLPEIKGNPEWKLDHFIIQPRADKWFANIQFVLPNIRPLPYYPCGWYGSAEVDLQTLEILSADNFIPRSDIKCNNVTNPDVGKFTIKLYNEKPVYARGESIIIYGTVPEVVEGQPVNIEVFNPNKMLLATIQAFPGNDGTYFSTSISIGGTLGIAGIYTVKASYLGQTVEMTFTVNELQ